MEFLKVLAALPGRFWRAAAHFIHAFGVLLDPILGTFRWSPPNWALSASAAVRKQGPLYGGIGAAVAILIFVGYTGIEWYLHLPKPPGITLEVHAPAQTEYEKADGTPALIVHPAEIVFSDSAAPIEKVGKVVSDGITMGPNLKGKWRWTDDRTLQFTPATDWPVGAHIEIDFATRAFAPHVKMSDDHADFDIPHFAVTTGTGEFYQDPQNATAKKTIMPVTFNYPVDTADFERHISLAMAGRVGQPTPLKFTVVYDAAKIKAWIHSQPLSLPHDSDSAVLNLSSGIRSSRGGEGTEAPSQMMVDVPGLYSLTVGGFQTTIVNNDKYEPEQVVVLNFSDTVRGEDLSGVKAWALPKYKKGEKPDPNGTPHAWTAGEVGEDVLHASQPIKLELVPTENDYADAQSFKFHAQPGLQLYLRVPAGLKSFGGYLLGKADAEVGAIPDYPKLLKFMADGSLLSLSGDRKISVVARNLPGMRLTVGRVPADQLHHLVSFNDGSYAKPELRIGEDHLVEKTEKKIAFPASAPGQAHYEGVDLDEYLKSGVRGVFLLHLSPFDPSKKEAAPSDSDDTSSEDDSESDSSSDDPTDTRLVVVTDLGIVAKKSLDGSRDLFVQSIHTGAPVAGAEVSVIALNGVALFQAETSGDGVAHFPTLKGLNHEKQPVLYVVKKGDDLSFLPVSDSGRSLDYSRFDIGGDANAGNVGQLSAYLFSDRGIYRPGDLFHIGIIVRAASWAKSPAGVPLEAEIVDPRGMTVKRQPVSVDTTGFTELSYTPAETAPTGTWTVNLRIAGKKTDETPIGSTTVSVKEFLPDNMRVQVGLSAHVADGWVKPDGLKGIVDAQNLFGTPAANRRVEASLTLSPTFPAFHDWAGYQFYDLRHAKDGYTTDLQDGHTDDKGHAEFDLDLKKYADATYRLNFLAKAHEAEGGRSVAATAETLVSSDPWLIGYRANDDLSFVSRGSKRVVRIVAIDPQTKSIALGGLDAVLIERRYVSVLTKQDSGVYKYESRLKEIQIASVPLALPVGGLDYTLATDKPGDYALLVRSSGKNVNRIEYTVAGEANLSRSLERNAELQVKLDKDDYTPGEQIEISLRAPYTGSGLITIERDRVYAHAWFRATTTSSVQHIAVPAGFEGNGYINVQYVRDPSSNEIFMSPLSYGVAPFSVNVDARRNRLSVDTPDVVKPGQVVTFKVHSPQASKVVVFAVDEGILQVAHYKLGDPLKYFFRKRMLDVETSQILDLILPDFKKLMSLAAPGGDADDAIGRQLNPFKRHRDKPVAYWSGIVDVSGEKDLQYAVPDSFNGRLRVMAVSVAPQFVGTVEGTTTVRGDFVLTPNAPTTLAPGDEAEISVGVANNLSGTPGKPMPVSVTLAVGPQFQLLSGASQTVPLLPMHEGSVVFRVRATTRLGSGGLTFTAGFGGKFATRRVDVSIRPAQPFRTAVDFAEVGPGGKYIAQSLRKMYSEHATRVASVSPIPAVLVQGLSAWLANYDNYCSEQIVSVAMPTLVTSKWPVVSLRMDAPAGQTKSNSLDKVIDVLRSRQNEQGGFGLWTATPDSEPFVSAYTMNFLIEARDRGVAVPQDMLDNGNRYLQTLASDDSAETLDALRQRAYAVYLLTRQGNVTTNDLAAVQKRLQDAFPNDWKNDLAAAWLAASYQMLKQEGPAGQLIARFQKRLERQTAIEPFLYEYFDDPLINDSTVLYLLAKHFPNRAKNLSPRVLENISGPLERQQFNTLSASMTILAIDAYASLNAKDTSKLAIAEIHANGNAVALTGTPPGKFSLVETFSAAATKLKFDNGGNLAAWGMIGQSGFDRDVPTQPIADGIEIVREYTDTHGNPLTRITVGEEIDVHLKIRATGSVGVGDVAIVDLLPGGFDPVTEPGSGGDSTAGDTASLPSLSLASSSWTPVYTDVREDRVVVYGTASSDVREFDYRIKAVSAGKFTVPPAFAQSMYDRRIQARSAGNGTLTVAGVH